MKAFLILGLIACGHTPPLHYAFRSDSPAIPQEWAASAVFELNTRLGCQWVSFEARGEVFAFAETLTDRTKLLHDGGVGEWDPDTNEIYVTDYSANPLLFGDETISTDSNGRPVIYGLKDISQQATERLTLHEIGHALGLGHSTTNFGDIMHAGAENFPSEITEDIWNNYLSELNKIGVKCPLSSSPTSRAD